MTDDERLTALEDANKALRAEMRQMENNMVKLTNIVAMLAGFPEL